jgi:cell division septum initiation protein DivIVA
MPETPIERPDGSAPARSEIGSASERISAIVEAAEREAQVLREDAVRAAEAEAARIRAEADAYATDIKRNARADARDILREAQEAARAVLEDGGTLSGHLRELSASLHLNAEKLLQDTKLAHARLTADLDQATPAGLADPVPGGPRIDPSAPGADPDFEVPEFLHNRR